MTHRSCEPFHDSPDLTILRRDLRFSKHSSLKTNLRFIMASSSKPEIFLLSLYCASWFDDQYSNLLSRLSEKGTIKRAKEVSGVLRYLNTNEPDVIIITDQGVNTKNGEAVKEKLLSYIRDGGIAIFGLHFTAFHPEGLDMRAFDKFWKTWFNLPWKSGNYQRGEFQFNPACKLGPFVPTGPFPAPYYMKPQFMKGARSWEKIYVPVPGDAKGSHVFPPDYVEDTEAAVVGAQIGDGFVVYIGDVNDEPGTQELFMTLCGLSK